jgi:hypothetical protein
MMAIQDDGEPWVDQFIREHPWRWRRVLVELYLEDWWNWITDAEMSDGRTHRTKRVWCQAAVDEWKDMEAPTEDDG